MKKEILTINRKKLYDQVWSKPMMHLAKEYGLSDNGLRKICRKLNIPWPKTGYWQQLQYGKKVKQEPLPELKEIDEIKIGRPIKHTQETEALPQIAAEFLPENQIKVANKLTDPHPLIKSFKKNVDTKGLRNGLISRLRGQLKIRVSPASLDRALCIMDALVKAFEARKLNVFIKVTDEKTPTCVEVLNETISFDIYELIKQIKKDKPDSWGYRQFDYIPTGKLALRIHDGWDVRQQWKDGTKKPLEFLLNSFIQGLYEVAAVIRANNLRLEKEQIERQQKTQQQEEDRKEQDIALQKIKALEADALSWQRSQIISAYLKAVSKAYLKKHWTINPGNDFEKWLQWTKDYVCRLDPLQKFNLT